MDKLQELRSKLEGKMTEVRGLLKDNKVEDAEKIMTEVRSLEKSIKLEEEIRSVEDKSFENRSKDLPEEKQPDTPKVNYRSAFNKAVRGLVLSKEERALLNKEMRQFNEGTKENGGYLVPVDDSTKIIELREADDALQNLITTIPVNTLSGSRTVRVRKSGGTNFELVGEGKKINKKDTPQYKRFDYNCKKYAAIYDITNEVLADSDQPIMNEMAKWIGHDSRENRNALILNVLNKGKAVPIASADDIKLVLNKKLSVPNARYSVIVTNQDGFHFLDTLKDEKGNYLLQTNPTDPTKHMFAGKPVYVYDNSIIPSAKGKAPMFIGDLKMAAVMFDRKKVSVKVTTEGANAFDEDLTLMRAVEREDVQPLDDTAFFKGEINISEDTGLEK